MRLPKSQLHSSHLKSRFPLSRSSTQGLLIDKILLHERGKIMPTLKAKRSLERSFICRYNDGYIGGYRGVD